MTQEQIIAKFCQGLNSSLDTRLEVMRPTSVQDALLQANKPLAREISHDLETRSVVEKQVEMTLRRL